MDGDAEADAAEPGDGAETETSDMSLVNMLRGVGGLFKGVRPKVGAAKGSVRGGCGDCMFRTDHTFRKVVRPWSYQS